MTSAAASTSPRVRRPHRLPRENLTLRFTPVQAANRDVLLLDRLASGPPDQPSSTSLCRRRPRMWPRPWCAPRCRRSPTTPAWRTPREPECRIGFWTRRTRSSSPPSPLAWDRQGGHPQGDSLQPAQEPGEPGAGDRPRRRDGQAAICEILTCTDDLLALQNFAYGDTPDSKPCAACSPSWRSPRKARTPWSSPSTTFRHATTSVCCDSDAPHLPGAGRIFGDRTPIYAEYELRPLVASTRS